MLTTWLYAFRRFSCGCFGRRCRRRASTAHLPQFFVSEAHVDPRLLLSYDLPATTQQPCGCSSLDFEWPVSSASSACSCTNRKTVLHHSILVLHSLEFAQALLPRDGSARDSALCSGHFQQCSRGCEAGLHVPESSSDLTL